MSLVRLARIFDFREWDSVSIAFPTGDEKIKEVSREGSPLVWIDATCSDLYFDIQDHLWKWEINLLVAQPVNNSMNS